MQSRFHLLFLAAIVACACGDDNVPPPSTGGAGGSGGSVGTGGSSGSGGNGGSAGGTGTGGTAGAGGAAGSGGAGTGGSSGTGGDGSGGSGGSGGAPAMGACDNTDDVDALAGLQPTNARQIAADCGAVECIDRVTMESAFKACVDACVERTVTGLSTECASCYGDLAWCSRTLCLTPCASNSCTPLCLTCSGYGACVNALDACAGRMSIDCAGDT